MKPLKHLIITLLLCLLVKPAIAQNDPVEIVVGNWENPMGPVPPVSNMCVFTFQDGTLVIHGQVRTADNNTKLYPEIYLQYDLNGMQSGVVGPITFEDLYSVNINGYNLYEADNIFIVDMTNECMNNGSASPIPFNYSFALVTPNGMGYELYPVTSYPTLFPPSIFSEILLPGFVPVYSGDKEICCTSFVVDTFKKESAEEGPGNFSGDTGTSTSLDIGYKAVATVDPDINVFPNPFEDKINLRGYLPESTQVSLKLYDASGRRLIDQNNYLHPGGDLSAFISTTDIAAGLYYVQVQSKEFLQTFKVVKVD